MSGLFFSSGSSLKRIHSSTASTLQPERASAKHNACRACMSWEENATLHDGYHCRLVGVMEEVTDVHITLYLTLTVFGKRRKLVDASLVRVTLRRMNATNAIEMQTYSVILRRIGVELTHFVAQPNGCADLNK